MRNWDVTNGDDAIALKANSSNVLVQDCKFTGSTGFAIGSIGQFPGVFEFIENATVERVECDRCHLAAYVKTWTGVQTNFPPNGGGGGLGFARNIGEPVTNISRASPTELLPQCSATLSSRTSRRRSRRSRSAQPSRASRVLATRAYSS